jgi:uncharacterized membrane protein YccC
MGKRFGFPGAIFSINSFAAAMLALYIGFAIGLERPYWSMLTVYITVQPLSGALRSKAFFRVIGTTVGGAAAVAFIPNFVNSPLLLSAILSLWVGLCLTVSLLDRTPRAYVFMLAGYTTGIIGFPSVNAPGTIFDTALSRVEEISLGIVCAALFHTIFFPRSVTEALNLRIAEIMHNAENWACENWAPDVLAGHREVRPDPHQRQIIAADITDLHILSTHLPFDTANLVPTVRSVRAMQDRLSLLLPLASAVEDRRRALMMQHDVPADVVDLLSRTRNWMKKGAAGTREEAQALVADCFAAEPELPPGAAWELLLKASLTQRLGELVEAIQDAREVAALIAAPDRPWPDAMMTRLVGTSRRKLHRDWGLALVSGFAAAVSTMASCAIWIATSWPEGAIAPTFAAIITSLFAALDDPAPAISGFLKASLIAMPITAFYLFAALPAIDGFPMLVAVLAPVFLVLGALQGNPKTFQLGLAMVLAIAGSLALQEEFNADFPTFLNNYTAQTIGIFAGLVGTQIFRSIGVAFSARRILRFGWRHLAANAAASPAEGQDRTLWTSQMLDRLGLLIPRLAMLEPHDEVANVDLLQDIRIGLNVADLQEARLVLGPLVEPSLAAVLRAITAYFRRRSIVPSTEIAPTLLAKIDRAINAVSDAWVSPERRACLWSLVGLRRNMFPNAEPYVPVTAEPV